MANKSLKNKNDLDDEQISRPSLIGLYEMLSQSENDFNSEYSSIVDSIEEISKSADTK